MEMAEVQSRKQDYFLRIVFVAKVHFIDWEATT